MKTSSAQRRASSAASVISRGVTENGGWGGFTLGYAVKDPEQVDAVCAQAAGTQVEPVAVPERPDAPLPDLPEQLLTGYLDAALDTLRQTGVGHDRTGQLA